MEKKHNIHLLATPDSGNVNLTIFLRSLGSLDQPPELQHLFAMSETILLFPAILCQLLHDVLSDYKLLSNVVSLFVIIFLVYSVRTLNVKVISR